jgi:LPPG:FO 2-phospho-L-lactate transferase
VLEALRKTERIVICPSNPMISVGPILAVPGIREALRERREAVLAVCPLVGGKSLKGPSDKMMRQMGLQSSALGVAKLYRDFCGTLMIDSADVRQKKAIESLGMKVVVAPTVMQTLGDKVRLARAVVRAGLES